MLIKKHCLFLILLSYLTPRIHSLWDLVEQRLYFLSFYVSSLLTYPDFFPCHLLCFTLSLSLSTLCLPLLLHISASFTLTYLTSASSLSAHQPLFWLNFTSCHSLFSSITQMNRREAGLCFLHLHH